jgi:lysophospholipase L1-like esterase
MTIVATLAGVTTTVPAPPRRRCGWKTRAALVLLGCVLGLACAEVGARVLAYSHEQRVLADWQRLERGDVPPPVDLPDSETTLGRLVRISQWPDIVYEFLPHLRARFRGQQCDINAQGFRGDDWPPPARTAASLRIVGLGDSVMFGWGVAEPDTFLRVLQRELAARLPSLHIEVLNSGVPGYNTAMEVATLEHKVLPWRPDLVLIDFVGNDADLPNLIARQSGVFDLDRCYVYDLVRLLLGRYSQWSDTPLQGAPATGDHFESRAERVPPAYRSMVGEAGVLRAYDRLDALSRQHGFRVLVTCHLDVPEFVRQACRQHGWALVENGDAARRHMREHGIDPAHYRYSELVLGDGDPHPSALGHRIFGDTIAAFLLGPGGIAAGTDGK